MSAIPGFYLRLFIRYLPILHYFDNNSPVLCLARNLYWDNSLKKISSKTVCDWTKGLRDYGMMISIILNKSLPIISILIFENNLILKKKKILNIRIIFLNTVKKSVHSAGCWSNDIEVCEWDQWNVFWNGFFFCCWRKFSFLG